MTSFNNILQQINNKNFSTTYILDGEEPYYLDLLTKAFEDAVPDEEKDFNLIVLYGPETNANNIIEAARSFPLMGERLIIIVKEAAKLKDINDLSIYIQQPMPSTVLVLNHQSKKLDGRSKLKNVIEKKGVRFTSDKLKENEVGEWIVNYCAKNKIKIEPSDAEIIAAYLGNDLQKIHNEISKILLNQGENKQINAKHIQEYIGISKDYNIFDFPDALLEKNSELVTRMLNYFIAKPKSAPLPLLLGTLYNTFSKMYLAYFTKENFQEDRKLGIWSKHRKYARSYPIEKTHQMIAVLELYSRKIVGIDNLAKDTELIKEMTGRLKYIID